MPHLDHLDALPAAQPDVPPLLGGHSAFAASMSLATAPCTPIWHLPMRACTSRTRIRSHFNSTLAPGGARDRCRVANGSWLVILIDFLCARIAAMSGAIRYYRVSTTRQGKFGLGIKAQKPPPRAALAHGAARRLRSSVTARPAEWCFYFRSRRRSGTCSSCRSTRLCLASPRRQIDAKTVAPVP